MPTDSGTDRSGLDADELTEEFEPTAQTIRNWIKQAELDSGQRHDGLSSDEKTEAGELVEPAKVANCEAGSCFVFTIDVDDVDGMCAEQTARG